MLRKLGAGIALAILLPSPLLAQNHTRLREIGYHDDFSKWVIGQVAQESVNGLISKEFSFNANSQITTSKAFGKLQQTLTYNADGTLATVKDGNNNTTTFSNWKRGIPQSMSFADGSAMSAQVDDNGWITAVVDQTGARTCYGYDAMGRISLITYPSESAANTCDSSKWYATSQSFVAVAGSEFGLPAGHWRQTITTGNAVKVSYYDAFWRPVVVQQYDAGNQAATTSLQRFTYDHDGRVTFASYPGTSLSSTGTWTTYDALGRVTSVGQDTELNPSLQLTTTSYLSGGRVQVTNPRGQSTITSYMAYDQPSTDWPVKIESPESTVTEIARDIFGKPTAITRRNGDGSQSVTRQYVYAWDQSLCKSIEPESGATVYFNDDAGNLLWSATGLSLPSASDCNFAEAQSSGRVVSRTYDARNLLATLSFPDGRGNQSWTYYPDGKPHQVTTNNANGGDAVINTYSYNNRRLLIGEGMTQAGVGDALSIGYGYDAHGTLATHTYPSGLTVSYAPNALGQPTQAGAFATGVSYYPNGAIKQFTYGNGVVHSMTQNARQLPTRSTDTGGGAVIDMAYGFDPNGNIDAVSDYVDGRQTRNMTYDGLDRLLTAQSIMFSGDNQAAFTYDALDNLKTFKVGAVSNYVYAYNAKQQLETVSNAGSGSAVIGLGYDAQGNLANKNGQTYAFDYGNRLRSVPNKESYRYDASGRRVLSVASNGNIYSLYGQDGVLRYQQNQRTNRRYEYVYLGGSLVARVSNVQSVGTATASVPASNGTGAYTVSWTAVTDATTYTLQEKVGSAGAWTTVYSGSTTSYGASGKGTSVYSYRVQACAGSTCGGWSNEATVAVTLPSAPSAAPSVSAPASSSNGAYSISWTSVNTATSYEVTENGGGLYSGGGLSTSVSGRGTANYTYAARACNSVGCGPWSAGATVAVTIPTPPSGAPAVSAPGSSSTGSYTVSWSAVGNASSYELQENGNTFYSGGSLSAAISGRGTGNYTYTARACNNVGCGPWSAGATVAVAIPTPPSGAPTVSVPGSSSTGSYTVSWSAVGNASSYELQENGGTIYGGGALSLNVNGRSTGSYSYIVRACNNVGCGPWSSSAITQVLLPPAGAPSLNAPASSNTGSYSISWSEVSSATSYELQENGSVVQNSSTTSYSANGKGAGNYQYQVRACNSAGCGGWSNVGTTVVTLVPPTPTGLGATIETISYKQKRFTAWWDASSGATSYQLIGYMTYNGPALSTSVVKNMSEYPTPNPQYQVRACNAQGCSPYSQVVYSGQE
ncbi:MAG: wall-associated protein [Pseudoxanthomonas spadix]|nr:MAG: wall-associated protein [Pseudoxanthomonas spadix]